MEAVLLFLTSLIQKIGLNGYSLKDNWGPEINGNNNKTNRFPM